MAGPDDYLPTNAHVEAEYLRVLDALAAIRDDPDLRWSEPSDLSRMSREALIRSIAAAGPGRQAASSGRMRLFGAAVQDSRIRLSDAGDISTLLSRLVVSAAAGLEGERHLRGAVSQGIAQRASISLVAAPTVGSIVFQLEPEGSFEDEMYPSGMVSIEGDEPVPLADRAFEVSIKAFDACINEDTESFVRVVSDVGPRFATALAALSSKLARQDIDMDLSWREADRPPTSVIVTSAMAGRVVDSVREARLSEEELQLLGTLRTISDIKAIEVELDDGIIRVANPSDLPVGSFHVGQSVNLTVLVKSSITAAQTQTSYQLLHMEARDDA